MKDRIAELMDLIDPRWIVDSKYFPIGFPGAEFVVRAPWSERTFVFDRQVEGVRSGAIFHCDKATGATHISAIGKWGMETPFLFTLVDDPSVPKAPYQDELRTISRHFCAVSYLLEAGK